MVANFEAVNTLDKIAKLDEELEAIADYIHYLISQPVIIQSKVDAIKRIDKKLLRQRKILEKRLKARYHKS